MTDSTMPTVCRLVLYRTDGRNGLVYDLPAIVTCTPESHPGDYPDGRENPLPVPDEGCLHLTVFTPGGFGTRLDSDTGTYRPQDGEYPDAPRRGEQLVPGSGTYVELNVPHAGPVFDGEHGEYAAAVPARTWRWPR